MDNKKLVSCCFRIAFVIFLACLMPDLTFFVQKVLFFMFSFTGFMCIGGAAYIFELDPNVASDRGELLEILSDTFVDSFDVFEVLLGFGTLAVLAYLSGMFVLSASIAVYVIGKLILKYVAFQKNNKIFQVQK